MKLITEQSLFSYRQYGKYLYFSYFDPELEKEVSLGKYVDFDCVDNCCVILYKEDGLCDIIRVSQNLKYPVIVQKILDMRQVWYGKGYVAYRFNDQDWVVINLVSGQIWSVGKMLVPGVFYNKRFAYILAYVKNEFIKLKFMAFEARRMTIRTPQELRTIVGQGVVKVGGEDQEVDILKIKTSKTFFKFICQNNWLNDKQIVFNEQTFYRQKEYTYSLKK